MRVLHVTESMGAGVATAIGQYAALHDGGLSHSLVARVREDSFSREPWLDSVPHVLAPTLRDFVREWLRCRNEDFDVVHAHSTVAGQLTRLLPHPRARTVYSPHGLAAVHHRLWAVRSTLSVSERVLRTRTSAVAAVSASEEADLRPLAGRLPVFRLPHAQAVAEAPVPLAERSGDVVCVGRLTYQKAPETVADLPRRLREAGLDARCVWVGDGDQETRDLLRAEGWVVTGWLDRGAVADLVARASVLLHPARYEGFSLAIVEALSHGTPAVARAIPGNAEFSGTRTFSTLEEAVALIAELVTGPEAWEAQSREAIQYVERAHGPDAQLRALLRLYGEEASR